MHRIVNLARYQIDVKFSSNLRKDRLGGKELDLLVRCGTRIFEQLSDESERKNAASFDQKLGGENANCHVRTR